MISLADSSCLCRSNETSSIVTSTTSSIPATSAVPADNSPCKISGEVLSASGEVVKRICYVGKGFSIDNADIHCKSLNMSLYTITDAADLNALLVITYKISMTLFNKCDSGLVYRVNGKQDKNRVWYYFNPNTTLLPKEAIPISGSGCLAITGANTTTVTTGVSCDSSFWPICEYGRVNISTTTTVVPLAPSNSEIPCGKIVLFIIMSAFNIFQSIFINVHNIC